MVSFSHTLRAELLRVVKQPLTWTLLIMLLALLALNYRGKVEHALEPPPAVENPFLPTPEDSHRAAVYPDTFALLQANFHLSAFFSLLLAATAASQGFQWGTVRTVLGREPRRGRWLAAQLAALAAVVALALALLWIAYALLGAWGSQRLDGRIDLAFVDGRFFLRQVAMLARVWLAILPVIALGLLVGVWARHAAIAITLGGTAYFLAWISLMLFLGLVLMAIVAPAVEAGRPPNSIDLGIWGALPALSPIYNMNVVAHWGDLAMMSTDDSISVMAHMDVGLPRDPWRSLGLLLGYGALALIVARQLFWRQDVTA